MKSSKHRLSLLLSLALTAAAAGAAWAVQPASHNSPTVEDKHAAEADPATVIHCVPSTLAPESLLSGKGWSAVPATTIHLSPQSLVKPTGGGSISDVNVKAVRTSGGTAFQLEWADATEDDGKKDSRFKDAAAIEFPVDSSGDTRLAMGQSGGPVNILHWSAESSTARKGPGLQAEELVAAGFYDRARKDSPFQQLQCNAKWSDGKWNIVIYKPQIDADPASPKFESGAEIPMALAVWNGSAGERLGIKGVSNWFYLHVD